MKKTIVAVCISTAFFAIFCAPCPVRAQSPLDDSVFGQAGQAQENVSSAPLAVFPETTYVSEEVLEGNDITHTFVVNNTGKADLKITKVKTA